MLNVDPFFLKFHWCYAIEADVYMTIIVLIQWLPQNKYHHYLQVYFLCDNIQHLSELYKISIVFFKSQHIYKKYSKIY